jgi:hypothetical protein
VVIAPGRCFPRRGDVADEHPGTTGRWEDIPIPCDAGQLPPMEWDDPVSETWSHDIMKVTSDPRTKSGDSWPCRGWSRYMCKGEECQVVWCGELLPLGGS